MRLKHLAWNGLFNVLHFADLGDRGGIDMPPHDRRMLLVWWNLENS